MEWHTEPPTSGVLASYGRKGMHLLLRRKKAPDGWYHLTPAQRSRTFYQKTDVFGPDIVLIVVRASPNDAGEWTWICRDILKQRGKCSDLEGYDWMPFDRSGNAIGVQ